LNPYSIGSLARRWSSWKLCNGIFLDETGCLTDEGVLESYRHGSEAHAAVEILLKGPEERLPDGVHFFDKDGHKRISICPSLTSSEADIGNEAAKSWRYIAWPVRKWQITPEIWNFWFRRGGLFARRSAKIGFQGNRMLAGFCALKAETGVRFPPRERMSQDSKRHLSHELGSSILYNPKDPSRKCRGTHSDRH
jgi:hypothetical protein